MESFETIFNRLKHFLIVAFSCYLEKDYNYGIDRIYGIFSIYKYILESKKMKMSKELFVSYNNIKKIKDKIDKIYDKYLKNKKHNTPEYNKGFNLAQKESKTRIKITGKEYKNYLKNCNIIYQKLYNMNLLNE